jgi:hypothetical protein
MRLLYTPGGQQFENVRQRIAAPARLSVDVPNIGVALPEAVENRVMAVTESGLARPPGEQHAGVHRAPPGYRARSFEVDFNVKRESPSQTYKLERDRFNLRRSRSNGTYARQSIVAPVSAANAWIRSFATKA